METLCAMCLLLAGCAGSAEAPTLELPVLPVRVQAADRRPLGIVIELAKLGSRRRRAIETWFFEALDQSPFLDLELDPGEAQSPLLVLRGEVPGSEQATGTLTTSFVENGKAPVPLAGVLLGTNTALTDAIDRLALATRLALGESRESVLAQRQAVEAIVSPSERVAAACALARLQVRRRNRMNASSVLDRALGSDRSCALALSLSAANLMDLGFAKKAVGRASRVLRLRERASPMAWHLSQRVLLMSRGDYEGMLALAERSLSQRRHDPRVLFTKALSLCFLARYAEALPLLEQLETRLPRDDGVLYCLGHARLASGRIEQALELLPGLESRMPLGHAGRLKSWILLGAGRDQELADFLTRLRDRPDFRGQPALVEVLGMQAAHALLRGKRDEAGRLLLEQLDLLRSMPSVLDARGQLLIDATWVLARLGRVEDCMKSLSLLRGPQGFPPALRGTGMVAYYMAMLARGQDLPRNALGYLASLGLGWWGKRIRAALELRSGRPDLSLRLLTEAQARRSAPTLVYELCETLRSLGRKAEARKLLRDLSAELSVPRMDRPDAFPLMKPTLALIRYQAEQN